MIYHYPYVQFLSSRGQALQTAV